ncbi:universal stress protein [Kribbella lupini]|uniref:Universal stress protein n=1 Tax=Kribbella lupini TaxID=291602 RepID=A0ABN2AL23_9ACTN
MTVKPVIYVGVDGSWRDTGALEWALQESLLRREPLRAVHVIEEKLRHAPYWEPTVIDDAAMDLVKDVQKHLDAAPGRLDHEMDLLVGPPARTLTEVAADSRMLVLGRRGMGAFKRLLIGSTSEQATTEAAVPVVVVPDSWKPSDHAGPVLVAVDDSERHEAVMEFAVAAAIERGLPLRLVHVWDLPNVYSWDAMNIADISDEWEQNARRHADEVAKPWRTEHPGLTIEVDLRRGHPVDGVVTAAAEADAQLLVVGGHKHRRVTTMLLGSVARGVLHHATCPIAVVHARRDDS